MATADYEFFIDWNRDNGLRVSDFETDFDNWQPTSILSLSSTHSYSGEKSLLATWNPGSAGSNGASVFKFNDASHGFDTGTFGVTGTDTVDSPVVAITYDFSGLTIGAQYTVSGWFYVPSSQGQHIKLGVDDVGESSSTSPTTNSWVNKTYTWQATSTTHTLTITAQGTVTSGNKTFIDYIFVTSEFEDVTTQTRSTSPVSWTYGRDQSRALNPISPAETSIELDNQDGRYSPNNGASPVVDYLLPNREILIRATYNGKVYDLFRGYLDDINVDPSTEHQSAVFSAVDPMASVGGTLLSTPLYQGQRTGDAINIVLDAIGWPANRRDIDAGASVIQNFWIEGQDASDAINDIVASEGPPAWAGVSDAGYFVFRDRHHRIIRAESDTVQATFSANPSDQGGQEPCFSPPAAINLGWKDIINSVSFTINQYLAVTLDVGSEQTGDSADSSDTTGTTTIPATGEAPIIWSTTDTFSMQGGTSQTFQIVTESPFIYAQVPDPAKLDYRVQGGSVQFSLDRTSGQSANLTVTAPDANIILNGLAVRGYPLTSQDGIVVSVENTDSQDDVGQKADDTNVQAPWANASDALAIGQIITAMRGRKLPTMSITVNNGTDERLQQILQRKLSDRIHIKEPRSYTDHDFYIESISHDISEAGKFHTVTFGCEAIPDLTSSLSNALPSFTFDDPQSGFDSGAFTYDTIQTDPTNVFILDTSQLDGTGGLGY